MRDRRLILWRTQSSSGSNGSSGSGSWCRWSPESFALSQSSNKKWVLYPLKQTRSFNGASSAARGSVLLPKLDSCFLHWPKNTLWSKTSRILSEISVAVWKVIYGWLRSIICLRWLEDNVVQNGTRNFSTTFVRQLGAEPRNWTIQAPTSPLSLLTTRLPSLT